MFQPPHLVKAVIDFLEVGIAEHFKIKPGFAQVVPGYCLVFQVPFAQHVAFKIRNRAVVAIGP